MHYAEQIFEGTSPKLMINSRDVSIDQQNQTEILIQKKKHNTCTRVFAFNSQIVHTLNSRPQVKYTMNGVMSIP